MSMGHPCNPGLPSAHVLCLKYGGFGVKEIISQRLRGFCYRQGVLHGFRHSGQHFGHDVQALEGLFYHLPGDSNEFPCFDASCQ